MLRRLALRFGPALAATGLSLASSAWTPITTAADPAPASAGEAAPPLNQTRLPNVVLFCGNGNAPLAEKVATHLKLPLGESVVKRFNDGECSIKLNAACQGKDVVVIQSTSRPVNDHLMELLLMVSAAKRAGARTVTAVIPFFGYKRDLGRIPVTLSMHYSRQYTLHSTTRKGKETVEEEGEDGRSANEDDNDQGRDDEDAADKRRERQERREWIEATAKVDSHGAHRLPIYAADVAQLLVAMGVDSIITVDLQPPGLPPIESFFPPSILVENLPSARLLVDRAAMLDLKDPVVVAPTEVMVPLCDQFAWLMSKKLGKTVSLAIVTPATQDGPRTLDQRREYRRQRHLKATLVGDVRGRDCVVVDDMIDSGGTLVRISNLLTRNGARRIVACASHPCFNGQAVARINHADSVSEVITTDTIDITGPNTDVMHRMDMAQTVKIQQVSVAGMIADVLTAMQLREPIQEEHRAGRTQAQRLEETRLEVNRDSGDYDYSNEVAQSSQLVGGQRVMVLRGWPLTTKRSKMVPIVPVPDAMPEPQQDA